MSKIATTTRGNSSKRENITTGTKWVEIDIRHGNKYIGRIIVDNQGDTLQISYEAKDGSTSRLIDTIK